MTTSRELQQVSSEVTALREAVAEKEEKDTHLEHLSPCPPPGKGVVTFVEETGSMVNTGLLVDIDTSTSSVLTESHEHSQEPQEPLIDMFSDCVLVPENMNSGGEGGGHNVQLEKLAGVQDSKLECLSQELF